MTAEYNAHTYQCILPHCPNTFEHPAADDCFHPSGRCRHLLEAGWTSVWARLYPDKARGKLRFSFGGWLCAEHSKECPE